MIPAPFHAVDCGLQAVGQAGAPVVLVAIDAKLVVLAEQLERTDLIGQLEPDPADRAGVLSAAVRELLDKRGL